MSLIVVFGLPRDLQFESNERRSEGRYVANVVDGEVTFYGG